MEIVLEQEEEGGGNGGGHALTGIKLKTGSVDRKCLDRPNAFERNFIFILDGTSPRRRPGFFYF